MNTHLHLNSWLHPAAWHPLKWLQGHWPAPRPAPAGDDALDALVDLDARLLDDIGAPQRLMSRALARREAQQRCRDDLHAGLANSDWRHW